MSDFLTETGQLPQEQSHFDSEEQPMQEDSQVQTASSTGSNQVQSQTVPEISMSSEQGQQKTSPDDRAEEARVEDVVMEETQDLSEKTSSTHELNVGQTQQREATLPSISESDPTPMLQDINLENVNNWKPLTGYENVNIGSTEGVTECMEETQFMINCMYVHLWALEGKEPKHLWAPFKGTLRDYALGRYDFSNMEDWVAAMYRIIVAAEQCGQAMWAWQPARIMSKLLRFIQNGSPGDTISICPSMCDPLSKHPVQSQPSLRTKASRPGKKERTADPVPTPGIPSDPGDTYSRVRETHDSPVPHMLGEVPFCLTRDHPYEFVAEFVDTCLAQAVRVQELKENNNLVCCMSFCYYSFNH